MTKDEYRDAIGRLGLTQVGAARFLGVNEKTSRRWASGESDIPRTVAVVLWLMLRFKVKPESVP